MIKNILFYAVAAVLFVFSIVSFNNAYTQMQRYSMLTQRSIVVSTTFQELSRQVVNASITNPELTKAQRQLHDSNLFFANNTTILALVDRLNKTVADSINIRIVKQLSPLIRKELPWLLQSNVPDSIIFHKAALHVKNLGAIDSLINEGIDRTRFLFQSRGQQLKQAVDQMKLKIITFLALASSLVGYTTISLFRQQAKRKEKETELKQSELRFSNTLEHMLEGVQIIGFDWKYIYVNEALTKYSNYNRYEMIGKTIFDIYPGVKHTELYKVLVRCMESKVFEQLESEFVFPDQTKKYFELSVQPVPEGIFILSVDITERKKALDELKRSIKEISDYKYALNESAIVAITDQKGIICHVNDNFCRISKYRREELLGKDHRIVNSGFHSKEFIANLWKTIASGKIWQGELKNKASDGSVYWVSTTIVPLLNEQGKPVQYLAIRYDVTERKKAEEEISKLNRLYAFISAINQSIVHINNEDALLKRAADIAIETGYFKLARIEMLAGNGRLNVVSVSGDEEGVKQVKALNGTDYTTGIASKTPVGKALLTGEYVVNNDMLNDPELADIKETMEKADARSGISLPIKCSGKMIGLFSLTSSQADFFDRREIDLLLEAAGDISFALEVMERSRQHEIMEQQIVNNERRFRALIENSTDLKTLTNNDGLFVYASPSVSKVFGYTEDEFLNKPAYGFFHPDDVEDLFKKRASILSVPESSFDFHYRIRHKNGNWIWCEGTLTNMLHEPSINALVSNFKDITERLKHEKEREKMIIDLTRYTKNLEQFAYVVSHNLRSPVANIIGLSNLINNGLNDEDKQRSHEYLLKAVNQLDTIVKDLNKILEVRAIIGKSKEKVNLKEIVQGIKDSISEILKSERVVLESYFEIEELHSVKSYIFSILYNLISNSIKYKRPDSDPVIRITSHIRDEKVVIIFNDNGLGMNLESYGLKVFGLYQRFHLGVSGKGMGLFMVKTQVESLEGSIHLKSAPGEGAEFTIELPIER